MMSLWSRQAFERVIARLQVLQDGRLLSGSVLDSCIFTLELIYREFVMKSSMDGLSQDEETASQYVLNALRGLCTLQVRSGTVVQNVPPVLHLGIVGRPRFSVSHEQLEFLVENHFSVSQISQLLGVSVRTVERRLNEYGISIRATYANLTDTELQEMVANYQANHPMCGNRQMRGHLLSRGFRVQQQRIREAQRAVDPEGSIMRRLRTINRRTYQVSAPRSLWHIDGNHKLIRLASIGLL